VVVRTVETARPTAGREQIAKRIERTVGRERHIALHFHRAKPCEAPFLAATILRLGVFNSYAIEAKFEQLRPSRGAGPPGSYEVLPTGQGFDACASAQEWQ